MIVLIDQSYDDVFHSLHFGQTSFAVVCWTAPESLQPPGGFTRKSVVSDAQQNVPAAGSDELNWKKYCG